MIALTIHTMAALGKLYSEVIEGIDPGPIEAIRATGANFLQVVRYGVIPQIVPPIVQLDGLSLGYQCTHFDHHRICRRRWYWFLPLPVDQLEGFQCRQYQFHCDCSCGGDYGSGQRQGTGRGWCSMNKLPTFLKTIIYILLTIVIVIVYAIKHPGDQT